MVACVSTAQKRLFDARVRGRGGGGLFEGWGGGGGCEGKIEIIRFLY